MKFKTTATAIRNGYCKIISVDYCMAQRLLRYRSPIAYTCGVYGWNFDVYDVSDITPSTVICTGYRGMPKGIDYSYELLRDAENAVKGDNSEQLLADFVRKVVSERWYRNEKSR